MFELYKEKKISINKKKGQLQTKININAICKQLHYLNGRLILVFVVVNNTFQF